MASQPNSNDWKQLSVLLETFASGEDQSMALARQIEGQIATRFPSDHAIQDLADAFAQYRPGGGDFLFSEADMLPQVARWQASARDGSL
jgi:hypothetical protein